MIKFQNSVTNVKGQGHIQTYFYIPTLRLKLKIFLIETDVTVWGSVRY